MRYYPLTALRSLRGVSSCLFIFCRFNTAGINRFYAAISTKYRVISVARVWARRRRRFGLLDFNVGFKGAKSEGFLLFRSTNVVLSNVRPRILY